MDREYEEAFVKNFFLRDYVTGFYLNYFLLKKEEMPYGV